MRAIAEAMGLAALVTGLTPGCREHRASAADAPPPSVTQLGGGPLGPTASASASTPALPSVHVAASAGLSRPAPVTSVPWPPPPSSSCPPEMADTGKACIDRWEAHLAVVSSDGSLTAHPYFARPDAGVRYRAVAEAGAFPQGYVNRHEAASACEEAGKRLCTLKEWYGACTSGRTNIEPYGNDRVKGACNTHRDHLLSALFGRDSRKWKYDDHFNSPELLSTPGYLSPAGAHAQCVTPLGVYDLVGNLHEWVSDQVDMSLPFKVTLHEDVAKRLEDNHGHGIFMGGFFSTMDQHGRGCRFTTIGHEPSYHDYSTGFRCCKDRQAPPSSPAPSATVSP